MQPLSAGSSPQHAQTGLAPSLGAGPYGQAHGAAAAASAPLQLRPARPQGGVLGHLRPSAAQALPGQAPPGQAPVLTDALLGPADASQPAQAQPLILGAPATDSGALADSSSPMEVDIPVAPTPQATLPADPAAAGRNIAAAQHQLTCLQHSADQLLRVLANRALPKAERKSQVQSLVQVNAASLEAVLAACSRVRQYAAAMTPQPMSVEQAWDLQHALDQEAANQQRLHKGWAAPLGTTPVEPADLGLQPPHTGETRAQRQQEMEAVLAEAQALTGLPISLVDTQGEVLPAPAAAGNAADAHAPAAVQLALPHALVVHVALSVPGCACPGKITVQPSRKPAQAGRGAYTVCRAVKEHADRACEFFKERAAQQPASGAKPWHLAMLELLLWLSTYRDLFSRPCGVTGQLLMADSSSGHLIPPCIRPFRLSHAELRTAAAVGTLPAFHCTAAPVQVL